MQKRASPTESTVEENSIPLQSAHTNEPKKRRVETITEESGESGYVPKRLRASRVSRACDQCRSKKDKCDGFRPTCSTCTSLNRACTYKSNPKKRGVPTGYIRTLEILWGIIFSEIKGSENVTQALLRTGNVPNHLATVNRDGESGDAYISAWKNSIVLKDIEKILSRREGDISPIKFEEGDHSGLADISRMMVPQNCEWQVPDYLQRDDEEARQYPTSSNYSSTNRSDIRQSASGIASYEKPQIEARSQLSGEVQVESTTRNALMHPSELGNSEPTYSSAVKLPSNAWLLFDIYFTYTHCWFPILEKHDLLRTAFSYNQKDMYVDASKPGSGDHAVMWAVLALTAVQDAASEKQSQSNELKCTSLSPGAYYDFAKSFIPSDDAEYEIGHVQALLILSLSKFGNQDWASAWVLVGFATRISLYLGLDHPTSEKPDSQNPTSRRKHVFLGCFALETLVASQVGLLPQLRKEHIAKIGTLDEDGLDEWQPWKDLVDSTPAKAHQNYMLQGPLHALSTFTRFTTLLSILNDICCYKDDKETKLSNWRLVDSQLHRWAADLPEAYRIKQWRSQTVQLPPHILNLHLAYEYTIATLYQCVSNYQNIERTAEREFKIQFADHCKRILDLLQIYIERYKISATSPIFPAYLHLINSSPCDEEDKVLKNRNSILDHEVQALANCLDHVWKKGKTTRAISHFHLGYARKEHGSSNFSTGSNLANEKATDLGQTIYLPQLERPEIMTSRPINLPSVAMTISGLEPDASLLLDPSSASPEQQTHGYSNPTICSTSTFSPYMDTTFRAHPDPAKLLSLQPNNPISSYHGGQNANKSNYSDEQVTNSTDLDALFEELASFDGTER